MASLPQIPNPSPITTPAVAEIVYDSLYIVALEIGIRDNDGMIQPLAATFRPYDFAAKKLYPDGSMDTISRYPNVWTLAYAHPLAAQVIGGLIMLLTLEKQLGDIDATVTAAQAALDAATDETRAELQATLDSVTAAANAAKAPILTALGVE